MMYSFETKMSPPSSCADTYAARVMLRVHIKITRLSSVDNGYTCAITVSPEKISQFHVTRKHNRSASMVPNADRLINSGKLARWFYTHKHICVYNHLASFVRSCLYTNEDPGLG